MMSTIFCKVKPCFRCRYGAEYPAGNMERLWPAGIALAIPFMLIIEAILSVTLNEPLWDVWDVLSVCLLLLAALYCFIWRYAREKGWLKKRRKEPRELE